MTLRVWEAKKRGKTLRHPKETRSNVCGGGEAGWRVKDGQFMTPNPGSYQRLPGHNRNTLAGWSEAEASE